MAAWIHFFSYDARNSYWVKSFFILFFGINVGYLIDHYLTPRIKRILLFTIFVAIVYSLYTVGDTFAIKQQKKYQYNLGDPRLATFLKEKFEKKGKCFQIYTTDGMLRYNYQLNAYRGQIVQLLDIREFTRYLEHNCSDGRLFVFRPQEQGKAEWDYLWKLARDKKWDAVDFNYSNDAIYFISPNTKFKENYFATQTILTDFPIKNEKEDVKFSIDRFKTYQNGISIYGWAFIKGQQIDKSRKYIVLKNRKNKYIVETLPWIRPDITRAFHAKDLNKAGFIGHIYFRDFPAGEYTLSVLLVDLNGTQHMVPTNKTIFIKEKK